MEENNTQLPPPGGSRKRLIVAVVIIVLAMVAYTLTQKGKNQQDTEGTETIQDESIQSDDSTDVGSNNDEEAMGGNATSQPETVVTDPSAQGEVKVFIVEAGPFYFTPAEIKVKKGDKVKIILNNVKGFHDWVIDEFNARTAQINGPATAEVEFVADKVGTFDYYCSVGNHRAMGMVGKLIVE